MKNISIRKTGLMLAGIAALAICISLNGCKASAAVNAKSGAQLWGENCRRCHNSPDPSTFRDEDWVTVGLHMQSRALLTDQERDKIVDFLRQ
jgi:hypothetical protein